MAHLYGRIDAGAAIAAAGRSGRKRRAALGGISRGGRFHEAKYSTPLVRCNMAFCNAQK
jgi:hypothetical protein